MNQKRKPTLVTWPSLHRLFHPSSFILHPVHGGIFLLHFPYPLVGKSRLRTVGVTHHRALWSPDFPLPGHSGHKSPSRAATAHPACTIHSSFYHDNRHLCSV